MDGLSAAASVIAVIQLSNEVVSYINTAAGSTKERRRLRDEVRSCEDVLQQLKDEVDESKEGRTTSEKGKTTSDEGKLISEPHRWSATVAALEAPGAPLSRLAVALSAVKAMIDPKEVLRGKGMSKIITLLKWPFTVKEVDRMIAAIEREKSLLILALTNNTRKLIDEMKTTANQNQIELVQLLDEMKKTTDQNQTELIQLLDEMKKTADHNQTKLEHLNDNLAMKESIEHKNKVLNWLSPENIASQLKDFLQRRQKGTGKWFLESAEFNAFLNNKGSGQSLFCPGIPGAGKTILASVAIEYLTLNFQCDEIGVAYLYCNYKRREAQTMEWFLIALLKQLAQGRATLPSSVVDLYEKHQKKDTWPSLDEIDTTLKRVISSYTQVFLVIDALDECDTEQGTRVTLMSHLNEFQTDYGVNNMVTSRFMPEIEKSFLEKGPSLEIRASEADIRRYLDASMLVLPPFVRREQALQQEIIHQVSQAVDGMFLLARLYINSLKGKRSPKAVRNAIGNFKNGSDAYREAYKDVMERIHSQEGDQRDLATQALTWVCFARRPLTTRELQHALAVEIGNKFDSDNISEIEDVVSVCAGLLIVDEESDIVRLVHYTTQEYFQQTKDEWFTNAEVYLAKACTTYVLVFEMARDKLYSSDIWNCVKEYPLFSYAALNLKYHVRGNELFPELLEFLGNEKVVDAVCLLGEMEKISNGRIMGANDYGMGASDYGVGASDHGNGMIYPKKHTNVHWAANADALEVLAHLIASGADLQSWDTHGRTPLHHACREGNISAARMFLDQGGLNVEADCYNTTLLSDACLSQNHVVVQLLLENGADPNATWGWGESVLAEACTLSTELVVKLLLEKGADSNVGTKAPLFAAAHRGHEPIVRLLLENKADVNKVDSPGGHALLAACRQGSESVCQLLIENGADIDMTDDFGRTGLLAACERGFESICLLLTKHGAALEMKNRRGCTALYLASLKGLESLCSLLLERGACINNTTQSGQSELYGACIDGHVSVCRLLLEKGADINMTTIDGETALFAAHRSGNKFCFQLLLENDADISITNKAGESIFFLACGGDPQFIDCEFICRILFEMGADIHKGDEYGQTALHVASREGSEAICRLLLENGLAVDSTDRQGQTSLFRAIYNLSEAVVRLLIENGADVNHQDHDGLTPLMELSMVSSSYRATTDSVCAISELLLSKGANVETKDLHGKTAYIHAFEKRNANMCELLKRRTLISVNY